MREVITGSTIPNGPVFFDVFRALVPSDHLPDPGSIFYHVYLLVDPVGVNRFLLPWIISAGDTHPDPLVPHQAPGAGPCHWGILGFRHVNLGGSSSSWPFRISTANSA